MSQKTTYFSRQNLVYLDYRGEIVFAELSAKVADWMSTLNVPNAYDILVDLRNLESVDRPQAGAEEFLTMQEKLHRRYAPARLMVILANTPHAFTFARLFEQLSEGRSRTKTVTARSEAEALGQLGLPGRDVDDFLQLAGPGRTLS